MQLPASPPQVAAVKAQLPPELQLQDEPPQVGGAALEPPHAPEPRVRQTSRTNGKKILRMAHHNWGAARSE